MKKALYSLKIQGFYSCLLGMKKIYLLFLQMTLNYKLVTPRKRCKCACKQTATANMAFCGKEKPRCKRADDFSKEKPSQTINSPRRLGADDGSRTHLSSLGSLHSTDELHPRKWMTQGLPCVIICGRSDGTWTHGLLVPNQARYQTSPHPEMHLFLNAKVL